MKTIKKALLFLLVFSITSVQAQETLNLQACLNQALQNNHNLKKSRFDREKSEQAKKEVIGALLPQVSGSANLTDNLKKTKFIMPNFLKEFLPASMLGGYTVDYMEIEMGLNYSTGVGLALNQQILNMSLFNAVKIAETAKNLATLGVESKEEDIISQTANIYYAIQVTEYAVTQFDKSLELIQDMLETMETSYANGIIKKVDLDRLKVTKTNIETQKSAIISAAEVQKNLLKLQMGLDMNQQIETEPINLQFFENQSGKEERFDFDINLQTPYKLLVQQMNIGDLQKKSAVYESLPVITFTMNYNYNLYNNDFALKGSSYFKYPNSMAMINMKIPIFSGLSRTAKFKQAEIEQKKILEDAAVLQQSLNMAYLNASLKLDDSRKTIQSQKENMNLAQEVYNVTKGNFEQGIASMSDVLNANSSLIQAQVNYADALNNYMKAYIDLRKTNGTIRGLLEKQ
jgi:outer membrane protein